MLARKHSSMASFLNWVSCVQITAVQGELAWSGLRMSELSDEASESEQFGVSLSLWLGDINTLVRPEELDVPLDLHTACSIGQYDVVSECIKK